MSLFPGAALNPANKVVDALSGGQTTTKISGGVGVVTATIATNTYSTAAAAQTETVPALAQFVTIEVEGDAGNGGAGNSAAPGGGGGGGGGYAQHRMNVVPGQTFIYSVGPNTGNYDLTVIPSPANYYYVDLNATTNGNGLTPATPKNVLPAIITTGMQLLFNSDNGVQTIPAVDDSMLINGNNVQVSSYGSGRACVSGFQKVTGGWSNVTGTVYSIPYTGVVTGSGNLVGCVIDMSDPSESPQGSVLHWTDMTTPGSFVPSSLPVGYYAYDWQAGTMYVNVGTTPNTRTFGFAGCGRFINTQAAATPTGVTVHKLRLMGFARSCMNVTQNATNVRIYDNQFYALGGMFTTSNNTYLGSGVTMSNAANHIEIDNNYFLQIYDSPITPQYSAGTTGTMNNIHIHHNTIKYWALAAVELSDFAGPGNTTTTVEIDHNTMIGGGLGYSGGGDDGTGLTDCVQLRGANVNVTGLNIHDNTMQTDPASQGGCLFVHAGAAPGGILLTSNRLSSSFWGLKNLVAGVTITSSLNSYCANTTNRSDAGAGTSSNDTFSTTQCYITPVPGQGTNIVGPNVTGSVVSGGSANLTLLIGNSGAVGADSVNGGAAGAAGTASGGFTNTTGTPGTAGSAGNGGAGGAGAPPLGGAGAASPGTGAGTTGTAPGGGGSGTGSASSAAGGLGGAGRVRFTYVADETAMDSNAITGNSFDNGYAMNAFGAIFQTVAVSGNDQYQGGVRRSVGGAIVTTTNPPTQYNEGNPQSSSTELSIV